MPSETLTDLIEMLWRKCREREDRIRLELGLSVSIYRGLINLREGETISCRELARRLELSESRGSRVIDRMAEKGFLERSDCDTDRRCKRLRLTEKGRHSRRLIESNRKECESKLNDHLPESILQRMKKDFRILIDQI